jgi:hypothetical protein
MHAVSRKQSSGIMKKKECPIVFSPFTVSYSKPTLTQGTFTQAFIQYITSLKIATVTSKKKEISY